MPYHIYDTEHPMQAFVCFSGNASAIRDLERDDLNWQRAYTITGAFTDIRNATGTEFFAEQNILCHCLDWESFIPGSGATKKEAYFMKVAEVIDRYDPDCIIFSGFMRIVPDWFIRQFPRKIINVHPTDLNIIDAITEKRKYIGKGADAIQKVLDDGREEICSTVHYVEEGDIDGGFVIAQSRFCKIVPGETATKLQNRLKVLADGEALMNALKVLCQSETKEVA